MAKLPTDKLDAMDKRYQAIEDQMAQAPDPETIVKLSKEHSDLQPVVQKIREYKSAVAGLADAEEMIASGDKELIELAELERDELKEKIEEFTQEIRLLLLPKDDADDKSAILEVRAGTGGDEAGDREQGDLVGGNRVAEEAGALGEVGRQFWKIARAVFQAGMHGTHQDTVFQGQEAEIQRRQQMRIGVRHQGPLYIGPGSPQSCASLADSSVT